MSILRGVGDGGLEVEDDILRRGWSNIRRRTRLVLQELLIDTTSPLRMSRISHNG